MPAGFCRSARPVPDALRACHKNFIAGEQRFKFVEEFWIIGDDLFDAVQPTRGQINAATAKAHVIAHHARAADGFE